jgi:hypothetical protein
MISVRRLQQKRARLLTLSTFGNALICPPELTLSASNSLEPSRRGASSGRRAVRRRGVFNSLPAATFKVLVDATSQIALSQLSSGINPIACAMFVIARICSYDWQERVISAISFTYHSDAYFNNKLCKTFKVVADSMRQNSAHQLRNA